MERGLQRVLQGGHVHDIITMLYARYNIECNKKRAEFDFDTREECESRPWRAFYLYIYTHTFLFLIKRS